MNASEITQAAEAGRPKQRLYQLLQERHRLITNRIWVQSLAPVSLAINKFTNELADGFKCVFKPCESKRISGGYITLQWKDRTEVTVRLDDQVTTYRDHNKPPWLQCQKVNDHRRRVQLRPNETPQQIVVRVINHFRNTDSELSTVLSWQVMNGNIRFDINTVNILTPPKRVGLHPRKLKNEIY